MKYVWVVAYSAGSVLMSLLNQFSVKNLGCPSALLAIQALCSVVYLAFPGGSKKQSPLTPQKTPQQDTSAQGKKDEQRDLRREDEKALTENSVSDVHPTSSDQDLNGVAQRRKVSRNGGQDESLQSNWQEAPAKESREGSSKSVAIQGRRGQIQSARDADVSRGRFGFQMRKVLLVLPSAALFALALDSRLRALQKTSMAAVTVVRNLAPLPVALGEWLFLNRAVSPPACVALGVIAVGGWLYSTGGGGIPVAPNSALFLGVHLVSTAAQLVYAKAVSTKLPPHEISFYVNLLSFPLFLGSALTTGETRAFLPSFGQLSPALKLAVVATAPVSVFISLAQSHCQALISATSFIILSNVLKVVTVLVTMLLKTEAPAGPAAWGGLMLTAGGGFLYAREQWRQKRRTLKTA